MPNEGIYSNQKISLEKAKEIFQSYQEFTSAIGHEGTAVVFKTLGFNGVEVNRIPAVFQNGDEAIALKLKGRMEEGKILTANELETVGYEFYHIRYFSPTKAEVHFHVENGDGVLRID